MKTIPGQELRPNDYAKLLARIDALLWDLVYNPLVAVVRPALPKPLQKAVAPERLKKATAKELHNAGEEALQKALKEGVVQLVRNPKTGEAQFIVAKPDRHLSDAMRAFGAKLNKATGNWTCNPDQVPVWVSMEAESYTMRARAMHDEAQQVLKGLEKDIEEAIDASDLNEASDHAVTEVAKGWKGAAKKMEVSWSLGPEGQNMLAAEFRKSRGINIKSPGSKVSMVDAFGDGVKDSMKVWAKEALARLRLQVEENATQGYRAEGLATRIRNEYGTSKSRSELIARQETSNFMANYHAASAADAGLKRYMWFCVRDARTRKDHLKLHGTIHRFDTPPITDSRTGARNNPGQDFFCRCVAQVIIE